MRAAKHTAGNLGEEDVRVDAVRESFTQGRFIGGPRENGDLIRISLGTVARPEMSMGYLCCWWRGRHDRARFLSSPGYRNAAVEHQDADPLIRGQAREVACEGKQRSVTCNTLSVVPTEGISVV